MLIKFSTPVNSPLRQVIDGFNESLFKSLAPVYPALKVIRFDGCNTNDRVEIELNFLFFKTLWHSLITHDEATANSFVFIDEGTRLPFGLTYWHHRHALNKVSSEITVIEDLVTFKCRYKLLEYMLYPGFWMMFARRKKVYQKIFGKGF